MPRATSASAPAPTGSESTSRGKRLLFWALTLLTPVVFFGALEGVLRLGGYGETHPLFTQLDDDARYLYTNPKVSRRYFYGVSSPPKALNDFFLERKPAGALRVFVQGGSTAAGFPFYNGASFSRIIERQLAAAYPDRTVEVVNTAMSAVNSYTLLDFVDEIIEQQPDAVVVYAGHNEYYGALGVGSAESLGRIAPVVNAYLKLQTLRTVQLLRRALASGAGLFGGRGAGELPGTTLMDRMVSEQSIRYGSETYRLGISQFEYNLDRLLAKYEAAGIPVFVGTVASNTRDHAPFVSDPPEAVAGEYEQAVDASREALRDAHFGEAIGEAERAIGLDSISAAAHFARGRALLASVAQESGGRGEADRDLTRAKDYDALRFRAPEAINAAIRRLAQEHGATLVDTEAALRAQARDGIVGADLMTEHLHPNLRGYRILADAFTGALLAESGLAGAGFGPPARRMRADEARAYTAIDSLSGTYRIVQLTSTWPFQPRGTLSPALDTLQTRTEPERLALAYYKTEINWHRANRELWAYYRGRGETDEALRVADAMIQEYPFIHSLYAESGDLLIQAQRFDEALARYQQSLAVRENEPARRMVGTLLLNAGQDEAAIVNLERAAALDRRNTQTLYNLAGAYARQSRIAEARETLQRLLQVEPDHARARALLASLPPG